MISGLRLPLIYGKGPINGGSIAVFSPSVSLTYFIAGHALSYIDYQ